jgi:redox-sensitive bicupin YhaK (pirin superfamily)
MTNIEVEKIIEPVATSDGAGVKLKRSIGTPAINYLDPFLMLDEFGSENKNDYIGGFPPHPHRGIETVTYMLEGKFEHEDSTGAKGKMSSGDVQWMKTGSGIIHSEMPAMSEGKLHGFQLWINMPAKLKINKPEYIYIEAKQMKVHKDLEKKIKIIAGKFGEIEGPVKGHNVEPVYFDVELEKNKEFNFDLFSTHNSFVYLIEGEIKIGDKNHNKVNGSTLIILTKGEKLKVKGITKSKFLLVSGKPIGEPIARGGPFVMNTKEEVLKAVQDYHNGTFVAQ